MLVARSSCEATTSACLINELPVDVLVRILVLSHEVTSVAISDEALLRHPLLHVCHLWRNIALNEPRFWKDITFWVDTSESYSMSASKAEKIIQRSIFALRQVKKQIELVKNGPANIEFGLGLSLASEEQSDKIYESFTRLF
jgi:hypothetical protein